MAQAARPSAWPMPNPCGPFRPPPSPPASRHDATAPARPKDAPCPASSGDRGQSGQCNKATPDNVIHKPSGGTYTKPNARVKIIPAEEIITYARHGKPFGRTVGSGDLQKIRRRRSVTPPPSSRRVPLARSTSSAEKARAPFSHKTTAPFTHKGTTQPTHNQKPTTPPPPVASCVSAKRYETAGNSQIVSLKRPSPLCKVFLRATVPPAVLRKESEMSPISPSSVHVNSVKVPLATKADLSKSVRTKSHIRNERQMNLEVSMSCNMSSGAPEISHTELYKKPDQSKSTTRAPLVEPSNDFEALPSSQIRIRNEIQINKEDSISCNMSSGAPAILHTELYKKPYQPESKAPGSCVDLAIDLDDVPSLSSPVRNERQNNQEASISYNMPTGAPLILHTEPCKKTCQPQACWKGIFEVTGELTHSCHELEAHFPFDIVTKVVLASKQMPEILKLEALPLSHLLPKKFKMEPPDAQDIGLFFRSSCHRPNTNLDRLLENISSHIGLRTNIGATDLLIFSSKLLIQDDQTKDGKFYLCGVFRKPRRKNSGIKLELAGKKEANGINICMPMLKTPDANATSDAAPAVSFFTESCSPVSAGTPCKDPTRAPACGDLILDSPPGCVPPPGFTSVRTGEAAASRIVLDSLGDVPPGFTPAHRGLHTNGVSTIFSEKSTIKLSLNVTRPVQRDDIPPGFSKPIGNVKEKEIKHDKVAVEVDDTEERRCPKIKRLSDILGCSPASSSNCSEVCRPAAAVPRASKFQETGPSDVQKLCRKRGQTEPSDPSPAEATKRLKVNGRIAVNRSMKHRALHSNQAQRDGGKS